jgi:hypothetical protein
MAQPQTRQINTKRARVSRRKQTITGADVKLELDSITAKMRDAEDTMLAAQHELENLREKAQATMKAARLETHSCAAGDLKIVVPSGRSSTYISPKLFQEFVTPEEFLESVKISVTKAREYLSGKEMNDIAEVTPAKPGKPVLKTKFYHPESEEDV